MHLCGQINKYARNYQSFSAGSGHYPEQAAKSLETIKNYVKEKFPMLGGAVDNMFASQAGDNASGNSW
jgi:hypothetical protein